MGTIQTKWRNGGFIYFWGFRVQESGISENMVSFGGVISFFIFFILVLGLRFSSFVLTCPTLYLQKEEHMRKKKNKKLRKDQH